MSGEARITITGNLVADPELRKTPSGKKVASVVIACTPSKYNPDTKEYVDGETMFFKSSIWGYQGELAANTLKKGDKVLAHGFQTQSTFVNRKGIEVRSLELTVIKLTKDLISVSKDQGKNRGGTNTWEGPGEVIYDDQPF